MYKTKLQELCHQRHWTLPTYSPTKDGPDHQSLFKASVVVNGRSFDCPNFCHSSKEAQNEAARVAFQHLASSVSPLLSSSSAQNEAARITFQHFTLPSSAASSYSTGSSSASTSNIPNYKGNLLGKNEESSKSHQSHGNDVSVKDEEFGDAQYVYKSQLQNYAQKRCLILPVYSYIREGSAHAPRFKAMVVVEGQTFESPEFCRTLKEAEHSAAKVALSSLTKDDNQEEDCTLYKNLLQVLTQKEGFSVPVYTSIQSGACHVPTFTSAVEVDGKVFHGAAAKTKKQAEMMAAKLAYLSLKERESFGFTDSCTYISGQPSRVTSPLSQFFGEQEALECSYSSSNSTLAVEFQQKLNFGCSLNSTPTLGCQDSRDEDQEADSAERMTYRDEANANHQPPSPLRLQTGFERLAVSVPSISPTLRGSPSERLLVSVPSVSSTVQRSSSPTTVLHCPDPLVTKPNTDLPAQTTTILCNRVVVYPQKQYMKIQDQRGITVLPISDDQWVAVSLDYPN